MMILVSGIINESRANDNSTSTENTTQTQEAQKLLSDRGKCGNGCLYQITTDATTGKRNLRVYNDPDYNEKTKNINAYAFRGNGYINSNYYDNFYSNAVFDRIIIDGDFETIGKQAFTNTSANEVVFNGNIGSIGYGAFEANNLTSITLPEGLKNIDGEAFYHNNISSISIPDSVTEIGSYAFSPDGGSVKSVDISDTLNELGQGYPFGIVTSTTNISITCKGDVEKCQGLVKEYNNYGATTPVDLSDKVTGVDKDHCTGEKYFWNGTSCSRKESYCDKDMYYSGYECRMRPTDGTDITCDYDISGYVKVGNNCYSPEVTYAKKHYTPAEANQWLHDGNDNFVVLTFKK